MDNGYLMSRREILFDKYVLLKANAKQILSKAMNDGGVLHIYKLSFCVSGSKGRKEKNEKYLLK